MHGDFLGYRLSFRPRDVDETKATVVPIEDPSLTVRRDTRASNVACGKGREGRRRKCDPNRPAAYLCIHL